MGGGGRLPVLAKRASKEYLGRYGTPIIAKKNSTLRHKVIRRHELEGSESVSSLAFEDWELGWSEIVVYALFTKNII